MGSILEIFGLLMTLLLVGGVIGGCQKKPSARALADGGIAGEYTLTAVNGVEVPATVRHEGVDLQVRSGAFSIRPDGTCTCRTTFVPPSGKEISRTVSATFTRDSSRLRMNWKGAGMTLGSLEGTTFTMNNEGMVFAYRKAAIASEHNTP